MTKLSLLLILNEYTVFRYGGLARLRDACSVGGRTDRFSGEGKTKKNEEEREGLEQEAGKFGIK